MNKHFELIAEYCKVLKVMSKPVEAIFYWEDDGVYGIAEIRNEDGWYDSYSCNNVKEFDELVESYL